MLQKMYVFILYFPQRFKNYINKALEISLFLSIEYEYNNLCFKIQCQKGTKCTNKDNMIDNSDIH